MDIKQTQYFQKWFKSLKDIVARTKIWIFIERVALGNLSNCKSVGDGVHEIKINYAKGYRVYFTNINGKIIILLCGGDKSTQQEDIKKAKQIKEMISEVKI
jgi:putative addiction module killer protein